MTRRLLLGYLSITVFVLVILEVPLGVFYAQRERDRLEAAVAQDASVLATIYEDSLERGTPPDPAPADAYAARTDARVVAVDTEGVSVVDTLQPVGRDFSTRPEIEEALTGARASGTRRSDTLDTDLLYVAVPIASGGVVHGALRVTLDTQAITARIRRFWLGLAAVGVVILGVAAAVGWALARSLSRPVRDLQATAARFARGDLAVTPTPQGAVPELEGLAETMNTMAVRLDELLRAQRTFVADASHQLRTPLTAMRLRLENLESRLGPDASPDDIEALIGEIDRLTLIVADLLRLARAEQPAPVSPVDLAQLTAERVDTWSAVAEPAEVTIRCERPDGALLVRAVPGGVEQMLDNLLDNAVAAAPPGTTVVARVTAGDEEHRLEVIDQGPGLSDEQKAMARLRFWRADATRQGSGLGLSIVDALASASGGRVDIEDAAQGGLAVIVHLPRVDHHQDDHQVRTAP